MGWLALGLIDNANAGLVRMGVLFPCLVDLNVSTVSHVTCWFEVVVRQRCVLIDVKDILSRWFTTRKPRCHKLWAAVGLEQPPMWFDWKMIFPWKVKCLKIDELDLRFR